MYKEEYIAKFLKNVHRKPKTFYMDALGNDVFYNYRLTLIDGVNLLCYVNVRELKFVSVSSLNKMILK